MYRLFPFAVIGLLLSIAGASAQDCSSLGKPSFTAERILRQNGRIVGRGVVFVTPGAERQENMIGGQKEITILIDKGRYSYIEGRSDGFFFPAPGFGRRDAPQLQVEKVGPNTKITEVVPADAGGLALGNSVICSPQGVTLVRDVLATDPQGRAVRLVSEHRNVKVQRLPASLFRIPGNIRFRTMPAR